jgi:hypothetical protein
LFLGRQATNALLQHDELFDDGAFTTRRGLGRVGDLLRSGPVGGAGADPSLPPVPRQAVPENLSTLENFRHSIPARLFNTVSESFYIMLSKKVKNSGCNNSSIGDSSSTDKECK